MGADSKIEWTHHTFNPWWGCTRVSPGCEHCYAETFAKRVGVKWGVQADRRLFGEKHWREPLKWDAAAAKAGERHRVFCASMADVFEDRPELTAERAKLFALIHMTPNLDWLLLTKRPENMERLADARWMHGWPSNVWAGCTVEDQRRGEERIPHLLKVPATVRFLSCEPLLERVDLTALRDDELGAKWNALEMGIHWVIVGGESGHGAREFQLDAARLIVRQCRAAGVAVHVKQLGASPYPGRIPVPEAGPHAYTLENIRILNKKGGDWNEWPQDLRVREYPEPAKIVITDTCELGSDD